MVIAARRIKFVNEVKEFEMLHQTVHLSSILTGTIYDRIMESGGQHPHTYGADATYHIIFDERIVKTLTDLQPSA